MTDWWQQRYWRIRFVGTQDATKSPRIARIRFNGNTTDDWTMNDYGVSDTGFRDANSNNAVDTDPATNWISGTSAPNSWVGGRIFGGPAQIKTIDVQATNDANFGGAPSAFWIEGSNDPDGALPVNWQRLGYVVPATWTQGASQHFVFTNTDPADTSDITRVGAEFAYSAARTALLSTVAAEVLQKPSGVKTRVSAVQPQVLISNVNNGSGSGSLLSVAHTLLSGTATFIDPNAPVIVPWTLDRLSTNSGAWFDGADSATKTIATGVSVWADKWGRDNNATQGTAGSQPTVNGNGSLAFSGKSLAITHDYAASQVMCTDWSIFVVMRTTQVSTLQGNSTWYNNPGLIYGETSGVVADAAIVVNNGKLQTGIGGDNGVTGTVNIANGNYHIATSTRVSSTGAVIQYVDGTADGSYTGSTGVRNNIPSMLIGGNNFIGDIAEIVMINSVLSTTERQLVEGYLAWKWDGRNGNTQLATALPTGHPYKSAAPTAVDVTAWAHPEDNVVDDTGQLVVDSNGLQVVMPAPMVASATVIPGTAGADGYGLGLGATLPTTYSLIPGAASFVTFVDATANGATLVATRSLIAGNPVIDASASGAVLSRAYSVLSGNGSGTATASGGIVTEAFTLIPGGETGTASVGGDRVTEAFSLIPGAATGERNATITGQTLTETCTLIAGLVTTTANVQGQMLVETGTFIPGGAVINSTARGNILPFTPSILRGSVTVDTEVLGKVIHVDFSLPENTLGTVRGDANTPEIVVPFSHQVVTEGTATGTANTPVGLVSFGASVLNGAVSADANIDAGTLFNIGVTLEPGVGFWFIGSPGDVMVDPRSDTRMELLAEMRTLTVSVETRAIIVPHEERAMALSPRLKKVI